jgi:protein-L-isoaspartate(D-aspartate) O-methyltransferase
MRSLRKAFSIINRAAFVLPAYAADTSLDSPLPIGFGYSDMKPSVMKALLEWLEIGPGDKTLEIGSDSGWMTAILAYMTTPQMVYAVAQTPRLVSIAEQNCAAQGVHNAAFFAANGDPGLPAFAPYDRIIVNTDNDTVPKELIAQLSIGGKMIISVRGTILEVIKPATDRLDITPHRRGNSLVPQFGSA